MTYNIHPILVHFPIAFFLLYTLLRVLPLGRWMPSPAGRYVRAVVLLAGVLGAFMASATGEVAEHLARPDRGIVEAHAFFAAASTWIYGLLLVGEVLAMLRPYLLAKFPQLPFANILKALEQLLTHQAIVAVLVIVGIVAITITGLLGGVMVYGTTADPLAPLVLRILGL